MTPEPYRTKQLTISEALASPLASAHISRRTDENGLKLRMPIGRPAAAPLRRSTYEAPIAQRRLVLAATLALAATGVLQAYALATIL
jgi:hypothetical protein